MVDGLLGIVAHDEWILSKGCPAVGTEFVQAARACPRAVIVIDDKHERFPPTPEMVADARAPRWIARLLQISVGNGSKDRKRVCHDPLPKYVKYVVRHSGQGRPKQYSGSSCLPIVDHQQLLPEWPSAVTAEF